MPQDKKTTTTDYCETMMMKYDKKESQMNKKDFVEV